ncbi:hypothetical protein Q1695_008570 [Nippostrongylus brasiliensis]|nr:hypothetical protein Q1695_008570 [Nippostrongylus brasiliensis]
MAVTAVFVSKTVEREDDSIAFTYRYRIPGLRDHDPSDVDFRRAMGCQSEDFRRYIDPDYDFKDPDWLQHCDEILRRSRVFNERLRKSYGIVPEKYPVDKDTRPRFLRTPDKSDSKVTGARSRDGRLRPPYTPYPGKTDKRTRDLARMIIHDLAHQGLDDEDKFRVTSTISPIAGVGRPFNPIRLVRSEPTVSRASTVITKSELVATRAASATSCLASNLISLTHTGSTSSNPPRDARSSSAHSRLTPQTRGRRSPTIADVVRFRNQIGQLSDFLRHPRHKPPKPTARSDSHASTQYDKANSSQSSGCSQQ